MADPATTEAPKAEAMAASEKKPVDKPDPESEPKPEASPAAAQAETSIDESAALAAKDETTVDSAKEKELLADEKEDELGETADLKQAAAAPVDAAAAKDADKEVAAQPTKTSLEEFDAKLPEILKEVDHDEMWGVKLVSPASSHVPTAIVLQKFLNANDGNLAQAIDQFKGALTFRKEKKPQELLAKKFSAHKFADLGAVTVYPVKDSAVPEVFTWNLYGNVKGKIDEVFVPLDEYVDVPSIFLWKACES